MVVMPRRGLFLEEYEEQSDPSTGVLLGSTELEVKPSGGLSSLDVDGGRQDDHVSTTYLQAQAEESLDESSSASPEHPSAAQQQFPATFLERGASWTSEVLQDVAHKIQQTGMAMVLHPRATQAAMMLLAGGKGAGELAGRTAGGWQGQGGSSHRNIGPSEESLPTTSFLDAASNMQLHTGGSGVHTSGAATGVELHVGHQPKMQLVGGGPGGVQVQTSWGAPSEPISMTGLYVVGLVLLNLYFLLEMFCFVPQIIASTKHPERLRRISLGTQALALFQHQAE